MGGGCDRRAPVSAGRVTHYPIPFDPQRISVDPYAQLYFNIVLLEDRDGALWLAASGNLYRMKDGQVTTYTAKDGIPQSLITTLLQDRQGQLWVGTKTQCLCRMSGNRFICYNTTNGLSSNFIRTLFEDREGTIWVGTHERGINRLTRQVITPLSSAQGLTHNNVYPVLEDSKGNFWIGSLTALSQYKDGQGKNCTAKYGTYVVQSLAEVREIAQNLRPFHIDRLGLTKAIEALVRKVNTGPLQCTAKVDKIDGLLTPDLEINLYRIIQESFNNIVKHSEATAANLIIGCDEQTIEITITENGKGFTPQATKPGESSNGSGMGLVGINERARILGGVPVIQSKPAEGTQIFLSIKLSGK